MTTTSRHQPSPQPIDVGPKRRHWSRVEQFSRDPGLLLTLDGLAVDEPDIGALVSFACVDFGIPEPRIKLHASRSPYTGACERPRSVWVAILGEDEVLFRERAGWGDLPGDGAIRLGRTTTLMTLSHELGHHAVFHLDDPSTPAHGSRWVLRFDQAAAMLAEATTPTDREPI